MNKILRIGAGQSLIQQSLVVHFSTQLQKRDIDHVIVQIPESENLDHFKNNIDNALRNNEIDTAAFYLDQLKPSISEDETVITALSERQFSGECIVLHPDRYDDTCEINVKNDTKVSTTSLRQSVQLSAHHSGLNINVIDISAEKLIQHLNYCNTDAIIISKDYYERMKTILTDFKVINLHPKEMIGPAGQGVIAYLAHRDDGLTRGYLKLINHPKISRITNIERMVLKLAGPECINTLGVYVYQDHKNYFHAHAVRCDLYKKFAFSQSTSEGLAAEIFHSIY